MTKYTCLNPIASVGTDMFTDGYEKVDQIADADVALVRSAAMHDMELGDKLLAVARAGAGVNNIPLDKCADKGIVVFNTPGANANGVKELAIAGMLLASRDITGGIKWVQDNKDDEQIGKSVEKAKKAFAGHEIMGKSLGIIGLGAIGGKLANAASALGMTVYGYDPYISVEGAWRLSEKIKHVKSEDEIYEKCDFISIHVPLLDSTKKMINAEAISKMKDGVVILNFARDLLVDEDAVADALKAGKVKKYVSDFPNPKTANMEGVILTPHLGASTEESEDNCAVMAVKELMDFVENGNIKHSVNYPNCDMGVCSNAGRVAICHKNIPNMITQFSAVFGKAGVNVSDMINKSRGNYAYTMMDTDSAITDEVVKEIESIENVIRVRVIK